MAKNLPANARDARDSGSRLARTLPESGRSPGPLEEEMAPHSSILAWKIPWTEEPGRLQSVHRVASQTLLRQIQLNN